MLTLKFPYKIRPQRVPRIVSNATIKYSFVNKWLSLFINFINHQCFVQNFLDNSIRYVISNVKLSTFSFHTCDQSLRREISSRILENFIWSEHLICSFTRGLGRQNSIIIFSEEKTANFSARFFYRQSICFRLFFPAFSLSERSNTSGLTLTKRT